MKQRIDDELALHLGHLDRTLATRPFICGAAFTGADVQITFVGEMATLLGQTGDKPHLAAYVKRMHERPAYRRAIERGGPSMLAV
jgi:glutathione S-transferase